MTDLKQTKIMSRRTFAIKKLFFTFKFIIAVLGALAQTAMLNLRSHGQNNYKKIAPTPVHP